MIFLRHPKPDIGEGICYGRTDMDIADIGHVQIEEALRTTPKITKLLSSPALRCRKLTLSLAQRDGIEPIFDERLWELDMGDFEGVRWDTMDREQSNNWLSDPINASPPNGEAFGDLQKRVLAAIEDHMEEPHETIIVICHASPIRAVQMAWQNISFHEAFKQLPPYAQPIKLLPPSIT
ncbi:MAG: histidine phosphatase family protein [Rhizobiales bacterium]|nr:histidine phosphatase family protein [Hyphomicrobiales bacterium]